MPPLPFLHDIAHPCDNVNEEAIDITFLHGANDVCYFLLRLPLSPYDVAEARANFLKAPEVRNAERAIACRVPPDMTIRKYRMVFDVPCQLGDLTAPRLKAAGKRTRLLPAITRQDGVVSILSGR